MTDVVRFFGHGNGQGNGNGYKLMTLGWKSKKRQWWFRCGELQGISND